MSLKKPFGLALALSSFVVARMMVRRDSFAGKVVVITGGSRGLGLALARRLAKENAKLAILARNQQELLRASCPLVSMDADRAACQILDAARSRRPELTITFAARLAAIAQALLPNVTAYLMKLTARLLPRMPIRPENKTHTGWESGSTLSPSLLTRIADRATELYNGLRNHPWSR